MCLRFPASVVTWAKNQVGLVPPPGVPSGSANDGQRVMISSKKRGANTKVMARAPCMDTQAIENRRFYCDAFLLIPEGGVGQASHTDKGSCKQPASHTSCALGRELGLSPRLFVRLLSL